MIKTTKKHAENEPWAKNTEMERPSQEAEAGSRGEAGKEGAASLPRCREASRERGADTPARLAARSRQWPWKVQLSGWAGSAHSTEEGQGRPGDGWPSGAARQRQVPTGAQSSGGPRLRGRAVRPRFVEKTQIGEVRRCLQRAVIQSPQPERVRVMSSFAMSGRRGTAMSH